MKKEIRQLCQNENIYTMCYYHLIFRGIMALGAIMNAPTKEKERKKGTLR